MAAFNWTYDASVGVFKNHFISNKLMYVAVGMCKILPFTQKIPGFGPHMGETVNIMHVTRLADPISAQLAENVRIPIDKLALGNRALTIVPWGRGVEYTDLMQDLSKFDIGNITQKELLNQKERAMDTAAAFAFQDPATVKVIFIPTSPTAGVFDTDGTPSTVATSNLTFDHIGIIADYMAGTLHIPPYEGDTYVGIASRKLLRGLKSDQLWQAVNLYLQKGALFYNGEMGMTENIRWVACHREAALSNTAGTSSVLGEGFVFGDEGVGRAEVESPHLRADPNYNSDFGRVKAVAWYGKLVFGSFWDTASDGEAKIIRIDSA